MATYRDHVNQSALRMAGDALQGIGEVQLASRDRGDPDLDGLIDAERDRVLADPSYTDDERLELAAAWRLLRSHRPAAVKVGLEIRRRVHSQRPGSQVHAPSPEAEALKVAERRDRELRSGQ